MSLNLKSVLALFGKPEFAEEFSRLLARNEDALPLQELCTDGGFPKDVADVEIDKIDEDDASVTVECSLSFTEEIGTSCSGIVFREPRRGNLVIAIDRVSGISIAETVELGD